MTGGSEPSDWEFESLLPIWPISAVDSASRSYREGRGFNSRMGFYVFVAQWSERPAVNRLVGGSNPPEYAIPAGGALATGR